MWYQLEYVIALCRTYGDLGAGTTYHTKENEDDVYSGVYVMEELIKGSPVGSKTKQKKRKSFSYMVPGMYLVPGMLL